MLANEIDAIIRSYPREKSYSLAIMQDMQHKLGYIPKESFKPLADYLGVKTAAL